MPHRVTSFFRNPLESTSHKPIINLKSTIRPRKSTDRPGSYASSVSTDEASDSGSVSVPCGDQASAAMSGSGKKALARLSLPFGRSSRDSLHQQQPQHSHAHLDWKIESPPIVFYGDTESSTGALVSGQLFLEVKEEQLAVDSFEAAMHIHIQQKRPFIAHCHDCTHQFTELKKWTFLSHPTTLPRGIHQYPFSILIPGHLPASMDTPVAAISYEFKAVVTPSEGQGHASTPLKMEHVLDVKRSLPIPDNTHTSVRVFPPTNIKAGAHYAQVITPTSTNTIHFKLDGLASVNNAVRSVEYWKLKKATWKLEETIKTIAPACERHAPPPAPGTESSTTSPQKGVPRTETRVLGEKSMHEGWKSDYGATDGSVELEFDYGLILAQAQAAKQQHHHHGAPKPQGKGFACNSKSRDGTEVTHSLMLEMVVSREWAPIGKPHLATQTGTGRILRMSYHVVLTEKPGDGEGVSWDNESPPVYGEVPPSPPSYPEGEGLVQYEDVVLLEAMGSPEPEASVPVAVEGERLAVPPEVPEEEEEDEEEVVVAESSRARAA